MAVQHCGYCLGLAVRERAGGVRVLRCPLCKTELGRTAAGEHFRLRATSAAVLPRRSVLPGLIGAVGVLLLLGLLAPHVWTYARRVPSATKEDLTVASSPPAVAEPITLSAPDTPRAVRSGPRGLLAKGSAHPPHSAAKDSPIADSAAAPAPPATPAAARVVPRAVRYRDTEAVHAQFATRLDAVPEVGLQDRKKASRAHIAELARSIEELDRTETDGFIKKLRVDRPQMAGLPFRLGGACRLDDQAAAELAQASPLVRTVLAAVEGGVRTSRTSSFGTNHGFHGPEIFWETLENRSYRRSSSSSLSTVALLPAVMQILAVEGIEYRQELIKRMTPLPDAQATRAFMRLALYDSERDVRRTAVEALAERSRTDGTEELLQAFRHPWPPVAWRAAAAIEALERVDLVDALVAFLDEPDPAAPFEVSSEAGKVVQVRELVRINHHHNCLLCHAPASVSNPRAVLRSAVLGAVPIPSEPLPPSSSQVYYSGSNGATLVRASVTYLRQDFSLMQPVADALPWPEMQRFDFLVRTRSLTCAEVQDLQPRPARRDQPVSEQHRAAIHALRAMTGKDGGVTAAEWRCALARR